MKSYSTRHRGGSTRPGRQPPTQLLFHCPSAGQEGENMMKELMGRDEDREITYQLPSWQNQTRLGKNYL